MSDQVIRLELEQFEDLPARTRDDVTITRDGRRLDTKEKLLAWLEELEGTAGERGASLRRR